MQKAHKKLALWKKILIVVLIVLMSFSLIIGGAITYFRLSVSDYYSASEKAFRIPDIHSGIVPQAFDYDKNNKTFLMGAYMKDGSPSPLYVINKETGSKVKRVTLLDKEGNDYNGHFSGLAIYSNFLFVAEGKSILVYKYSLVKNASDGDKIECLGKVSTYKTDTDYVRNSFLTVYGSTLIAGEFYRSPNYETPNKHKITTKAGDYNQAIAVEYNLSSSYSLGIDPTPVKAYSLPDKVQGMYITSTNVYLSTSYGISFSHIYEYTKNSLTLEKNMTILGTSVPVYSLDSSSLVYDFKIPPMSKEIVVIDNNLYTMCESASTKYIFGNLIGSAWCYKTDLTALKLN